MSAREVGRVWMDGHVEMDEKVYADMAHRDDLARDVAREWARYRADPTYNVRLLHIALNCLAAAYGETP